MNLRHKKRRFERLFFKMAAGSHPQSTNKPLNQNDLKFQLPKKAPNETPILQSLTISNHQVNFLHLVRGVTCHVTIGI